MKGRGGTEAQGRREKGGRRREERGARRRRGRGKKTGGVPRGKRQGGKERAGREREDEAEPGACSQRCESLSLAFPLFCHPGYLGGHGGMVGEQGSAQCSQGKLHQMMPGTGKARADTKTELGGEEFGGWIESKLH